MQKRGDDRSLSLLYDQYAPMLYGLLVGTLKSEEKAELALEKTFLTIHKEISLYNGHTTLLTWMCCIARKAALELLNSVPDTTTDSPGELCNQPRQSSKIKLQIPLLQLESIKPPYAVMPGKS